MIKTKHIKPKFIKKEQKPIWADPLFAKPTHNPEEYSSPSKKQQRVDYDLQSMITAVEMCEFVLEPQQSLFQFKHSLT